MLGPFTPSAKGNRFIVVITDYFTRWPEAFPVPHAQAPLVAKILVDQIVFTHGAPRYLMSDRGQNFLSKLIKETAQLLNIAKINTSGYRPQCNSVVERFNATSSNAIFSSS